MVMHEIKSLKKALVTLSKALGKLLLAEKEKTGALERGDIESLKAQINVDMAYIMECSAAEKRIQQICSSFGVSNMSELYEKYPEAEESVGELHAELLDTVKELQKVKNLNERLVETRLSVIRLMNSQLGISSENTQYGKPPKAP
jgi:hypothetical protein